MEAPDEKWQHYWDLHVMAAVRLARGIVPGMKRRGGGVILHNASICATQPLWYEPIYNVTKSALMMFSKTLANEVVKDNIRVNTVNAGLILTPDWIKTAKQLTADKGGDWEGYLQSVARRARADQALRQARGACRVLRVPLLGPCVLLGRVDLFRRRRHAEDGADAHHARTRGDNNMAHNFLSELTGSFAMPAAENPTVAMIEAAYRHHQLDWRYINCEVTPANLGAAVSRCAGHELGGVQLLAAAQGGGHPASGRTG